MASLANVHAKGKKEPKSRGNLAAWKAVVDYVNAGPSDVLAAANQVLASCGFWWAQVDMKEDLNEQTAAAHQEDIRKLLIWFSTRGQSPIRFNCDGKLTLTPVQFLNNHAHGVRWELEDYGEPNDPAAPYFIRLEEYDSLLSPICAFLVAEVSGPKGDDIPVRICQRAGCGHFLFPKREGRKLFCSDRCRVMTNRPSRAKWADYKWLLRLYPTKARKKNALSGTLKAKLMQPQVKERLGEIMARWPRNDVALIARELLARAK